MKYLELNDYLYHIDFIIEFHRELNKFELYSHYHVDFKNIANRLQIIKHPFSFNYFIYDRLAQRYMK